MKRKIVLIFTAVIFIFGFIIISSSAADLISLGDVNGDMKITAQDARKTLRIAINIEPAPTGAVFWAADVNKDKRITSSDARSILRAAIKIEFLPKEYYDESTQDTSKTYILLTELIPSEPETEMPTKPSVTTEPPSYTPPINYPTGDEYFPMPAMPDYDKSSGTFAFISYGWGHGVGLSQYGSIYLADYYSYDYLNILGYYYRGGVCLVSETPPERVLMNDKKTYVNTVEILARITQKEIAGVTHSKEALKAQVVVAYTNIVADGYVVDGMAYKSSMSEVRDDVLQAVYDVYGQYLVYNGKPIAAVFGAISAGITANPAQVWGGNYPYLAPVSSPFDRVIKGYLTVKTYTADEIRAIIENFNAKVRAGRISYCGEITLSDDPSTWFEILAHDGAVSNQVGYVTSLRIGDQIISERAGQRLREAIFGYDIRSHCLIIEYYK